MQTQSNKQQHTISPEVASKEAAEDLMQFTDMDEFKDLTSELVVSYFANEHDLSESKKDQIEAFHWSMTRFLKSLAKIQHNRFNPNTLRP